MAVVFRGGGQVKHRGSKKQTGLSDLSIHFHYCGGGGGGGLSVAEWLKEVKEEGLGYSYKYIHTYILP